MKMSIEQIEIASKWTGKITWNPGCSQNNGTEPRVWTKEHTSSPIQMTYKLFTILQKQASLNSFLHYHL